MRLLHGHFRKHKQSKTYAARRNMLTRCYFPKHRAYKWYGERGITVCPAWRGSFVSFLHDLGEANPGMSLERIDSNGNYEPANCRWIPLTEQNRNRPNFDKTRIGRAKRRKRCIKNQPEVR